MGRTPGSLAEKNDIVGRRRSAALQKKVKGGDVLRVWKKRNFLGRYVLRKEKILPHKATYRRPQ
jgi:hypothetical protein